MARVLGQFGFAATWAEANEPRRPTIVERVVRRRDMLGENLSLGGNRR